MGDSLTWGGGGGRGGGGGSLLDVPFVITRAGGGGGRQEDRVTVCKIAVCRGIRGVTWIACGGMGVVEYTSLVVMVVG